MSVFSGDDKMNIRNWLQEFEEMLPIFVSGPMSKRSFAPKDYYVVQQECKSWNKMKKALACEISRAVDAHKVHKELSRRTKKPKRAMSTFIKCSKSQSK